MSKPLTELMALRADLDAQIAKAQREERANAIAQITNLMSQYGLTMADVQAPKGKAKTSGSVASKVAVKYRDQATGDTWTGRGLQPKWLRAAVAAGKTPTDFLV